MKILALETSAKAVSAAVSENGRILASGYQDTGLTHSRLNFDFQSLHTMFLSFFAGFFSGNLSCIRGRFS